MIFPPLGAPAGPKAQAARLGLRINEHVSAPLVFTGIFSAVECDRISHLGGQRRGREGRMMYGRQNIRKCKIAWIGMQAESEWLYAKIWQTFRAVNQWFQFDLLGLVDEIQFTTYAGGDRIDWHLDSGGGQTSTRKISMSVQLNDAASYEGGDLEFSGCSISDPMRGRGTIIVFPAVLAHRVTEVTSGVRTSLVAWAHGPVFK